MAALAALSPVPIAHAAAPANNNYASAQFLAGPLPLNVDGSNVEATKEAGEPNHTPVEPAGKSVWYSWTAPATKKFVADSCAADYNSVTAVYTSKGGVGELTPLEFPAVDRCRVEFSATSGVSYKIAIDGTNVFNIPPANPDGAFTLQIRELSRPANDLFANAQTVGASLPQSVTSTNVDALSEADEPKHGGEQLASSSVWFKWTAGFTGQVSIDTCSGEFDSRLAVYTGATLKTLSEVKSNDDGCFQQSKVTFEATNGTEYKIAVDGFNTVGAAVQGPFTLRIHVPSAPSNDNFAGPKALSPSVPLSISDSNEDATKEENEPEHSEINKTGASVWYSWKPSESGPVAIDTCESNFQAAVAVYTGSAIGSLTKVVKNIYGCGVAARANFVATAGTEYRIAVAGVNADQGEVKLRIRKRPANDDFADAQEISGALPLDASGNNVNASAQPSEPQHVSGGGSGSVWFKWKATANGIFFVESCDSAIESTVAVYTGTQVNSLTAKWVFRSNCKKYFQATKDTIYQIAVDGKVGEQGATDLVLREASGPANDNFANAQVIGGSIPQTVEGDTIDSSVEAGEPEHAGSNANTTVWYEWKPAASGAVRISDCGGSDMIVAVYTGSTLGGLTPSQGTPTGGEGSRLTRCNIRLNAVAGTTYRIAVVSVGFEADPFTLSIRTPSPPANDAFAAAHALSSSLSVAISGTNVDATKEAGEPNHNGNAGSASVWYSWIAPSSASVTIDVCVVPSNYFGMDEVYTGTALNNLVKVGTRKSRCRIKLEAVAATKYWIAVDGFVSLGSGGGAEGTFELGIHAGSPPPNDNFSAAQTIAPGALPLTANGTNLDATAEGNEPKHAGFTPSATVWYSWTPSESKTVVIEGCESAVDAGAGPPTAVYQGGAVGSLAEQGIRQGRCRVQLAAVSGTPYKIAIGSIGLIEGGLTLTIRSLSTPSNDNFASPKVLSPALPINEAGTNLDAGRETGEPNHASTIGTASVWYSWTPGANEEVEVNACSTGTSNTLLGVYVGTNLTELEKAGTRAPPGSPFEAGRLCKVVLDAVSGTTYRIAIDRSSGIEGSTQLTVGPPGTPTPPSPPVLTGTSPASGANNNNPHILGTASGATVKLYESGNCSGAVEATGTPAQLASPGLLASVADNTTSQFSAKAENAAGPSGCSNAIVYKEVTPSEPPPGGGGGGGGGGSGSSASASPPASTTPPTTSSPAKPLKCKKGFKKVKVKGKLKCKKKKKKGGKR